MKTIADIASAGEQAITRTLYVATYNHASEIFDNRGEAEAFAAEMNDDYNPFKTSIHEIDFAEAFDLCKNGRVSYFGEKWDGNQPKP